MKLVKVILKEVNWQWVLPILLVALPVLECCGKLKGYREFVLWAWKGSQEDEGQAMASPWVWSSSSNNSLFWLAHPKPSHSFEMLT